MAKDTIAVHWEAAAPRSNHAQCAQQVEDIRRYHRSTGYSDIAYSWLVCQHGQIFQGRGWGSSAATCGSAWNSRADSVCWMGGPGFSPSGEALNSIRTVILQAQARGMTNVIGHRDACSTQCPGDDLWHWVHTGFPGGPGGPSPEEDDLPYSPDQLNLILQGALHDAVSKNEGVRLHLLALAGEGIKHKLESDGAFRDSFYRAVSQGLWYLADSDEFQWLRDVIDARVREAIAKPA